MQLSSDVEERSKKTRKQSSSESIRMLEPDEMPVAQDTKVDLSKLPFRIANAFDDAFLGTTYIWSTFYKVWGLYCQACNLGLLDKYIVYGGSTQGLWSEMCKEVENDVTGLQTMPDDAQLLLPGHSPSPSRNTLPYTNVMRHTLLHVTKEHVGFHSFGVLDDDPFEDFPEDHPQVVGCEKDCVKLVAHEDNTTITDVAKHFHGHPDFHQDALILVEALQMGEAVVRWDQFTAHQRCPAIAFVEGYVWWDTAAGGLY
ncbi:hypothetical protein K439DRAFT_1616198 [Ramaria rubella]|nr:hypothetical protein K439DRAFT_1616198 [Ramaria rubella]